MELEYLDTVCEPPTGMVLPVADFEEVDVRDVATRGHGYFKDEASEIDQRHR